MKWGSKEGQGIVRQRSQPGDLSRPKGSCLMLPYEEKTSSSRCFSGIANEHAMLQGPMGLSGAPSCLWIPTLEIFTRRSSCPRECGKGTISDGGRR